MKVFLDTNIFLEYFQRRRQYQSVSRLLSAIEDGQLKAVVSTGCVYGHCGGCQSQAHSQWHQRPCFQRCGRQFPIPVRTAKQMWCTRHHQFEGLPQCRHIDDRDTLAWHVCKQILVNDPSTFPITLVVAKYDLWKKTLMVQDTFVKLWQKRPKTNVSKWSGLSIFLMW